MELTLNILARLNISGLFPEQGNLVDQILIKSIAEKTAITSDEANTIQLRQENIGVKTYTKWDASKAKDKVISLNQSEVDFLKEQVKRLDTEKRITQDNVQLCLDINNLGSKEEPKK